MNRIKKFVIFPVLVLVFCLSMIFGISLKKDAAKRVFAEPEANSLSKTMHIVSKDNNYVLLATAVPMTAVNGEDDYVMGYTVNGDNNDVAVLYETIVLISGEGTVEYTPEDIFGGEYAEGYLLLVNEFDYAPGEPFDFKAYFRNVSQDITYSSTSYSNESFIVSFNSNGGTEVVEQNVNKYLAANRPADPVKIGYDFVKWQKAGVDYDFATPITSAVTLDAVWVLKDYTDYAVYNVANTDIDMREAEDELEIALPAALSGAEVVFAKVGDEDIETEIDGNNAVITVDDLPYGESDLIVFTYKDGVYASASIALTKATAVLNTKADLDAIKTLAEEEELRENYWGGYFVLGADINCGGASLNTIAAFNSTDNDGGFVGTLDGRGYAIDNFTFGNWGYGLIGGIENGSVIKNIAFTNVAHPGYTSLLGIRGENVNISNVYVQYKSVNYPAAQQDCTGMLLGLIKEGSKISNVIIDLTAINVDFAGKDSAFVWSYNYRPTCYTNCYVVGSGSIKLYYESDVSSTGRYETIDDLINADIDYSSFDTATFDMVEGVPGFVKKYIDKRYEENPDYIVANTDIDMRTAGITVTVELPAEVSNYSLKWAHNNGEDVAGVTVDNGCSDVTVPVSSLTLGESTVTLLLEKGDSFKSVAVNFTKATAVLMTKDDLNAMSSLAAAADDRENYWGGYFVLGTNIDMGGSAMTTVAAYNNSNDGKGFVGTFDGRGYIINNFTVGYWAWGMFGGLGNGSVIKNVSLTNVAHPGYTALLGIKASNVDISNIYVQYKSINYPGTGDATGLLLGTIWGGSVRNVVVDITKAGVDFSNKENADALVFNNKGDYFTNCYVIGSDSIKLSWANASFTTGRYASWDAFVAAGNDLSSFNEQYWDKVDGKLYGKHAVVYLDTWLLTNITDKSQVTNTHDYDRGITPRQTVGLNKGMITKTHRVYLGCGCHTHDIRYSGLNLTKDQLIALREAGMTKVRVAFADETGLSSDVTITANFGTRKSITVPGGHGWDYTSYVLEIPLDEVIENYDTISAAWYAFFTVTNSQEMNLGISDMVIV